MALGPVNFSGVISGLDFQSIIEAIINAERRPVTQLQNRQQTIDAKRSALNDFSAKLSSLRTILDDLAAPATTAARTVSSSNTDILNVSAAANADSGLHEVDVLALARSDRVRSFSVSSQLDPVVTDGTITIQSGSKALITIDVSSANGNNSLAAIKDQINTADAGVTATIINDGTGDLLAVRSTETGTINGLSITDSTNLGLTDAGNVLETAADASLLVDGVTVTSSSNTISTAISGVTLSLVSESPGTKVSVSVEADTEAVKAKIQEFVDAYNEVADLLKQQSEVDPATNRSGVLAGDSVLRQIQGILASAVSSGVVGLPPSGLTSLGALGVSIEGASGRLEIDSEKLDEALEDRFDEIQGLFAATGAATDSAVSYVNLTSATIAGSYAIQVSTAPERATISGSTPIRPQGLKKAETLTFTVGATVVDVDLAKSDQIGAVVSKINTALTSAGVGVRAFDDSGKLRLDSLTYGSAATFSVVSDRNDAGNGAQTGIGTSQLADFGVDIVGTIDGVAATGIGTILTGAVGTSVEGLDISVTTDAAGVAARGGDFGTITVTRGVADFLSRDLKSIVDPIGGLITGVVEGIDNETRRIDDQIAEIEARLLDREAFLVRQFSAAERAIQALQTQQASLRL